MTVRLLEPVEVKKLLDLCIKEAEEGIFDGIKSDRESRPSLLAELDALRRITERIHARLEYNDPFAHG
jgi:hypothetical protein